MKKKSPPFDLTYMDEIAVWGSPTEEDFPPTVQIWFKNSHGERETKYLSAKFAKDFGEALIKFAELAENIAAEIPIRISH